ncbi:MAG: hypothetical protein HWN67_07660 [Candidatus Helarchaeota archaeon]|nr:hypothetical protein [Candidatus Helarchaeota archaeon]
MTDDWLDRIEKNERRVVDKENGYYIFEKCYTPINDDFLKEKGIDVCALTEIRNGKIEKNLVLLRKGKKFSFFNCTHFAIGEFEFNEHYEPDFKEIPHENRPDLRNLLAPGEYFIASKSFVESLIQKGIQKCLIESIKRMIETGVDPIDFSLKLRKKILKALVEIAPEDTKELIFFILDYFSAGDRKRYEILSQEFKEIICNHFIEEDFQRLNDWVIKRSKIIS